MTTTEDRTAILASLAAAKERQDKARNTRIRLMRRARELGIPNTRIAAAMGITEGAVRVMLKRANRHDRDTPAGQN